MIQSAVAAFAEPAFAAKPESHSTRLFFNRDAASFASALNKVFDIPVDALGKDTLIFSTTKPEDDEHIRDLTNRIANLGYVALGVDLYTREGGPPPPRK